jgi:hypothetical protein
MTDRDTLRMRFRIANPVPDPDAIETDELDRILLELESEWDHVRGFVALPKKPAQDRRSRLVPGLVFAAAVLLILLAVGLPMLFFGGGEDLPPVDETTTVPTTTATTVPPTTVPSNPTTTTEVPQAALAPPMTWERVPHQAIFEDATIFEVVNGGPGLVAVGALGDWNSYDEISQAAVFVSRDGVDWERLDSALFVGEESMAIDSIAVGPDSTLVAFGRDGNDQALFVSPDGLEWERINSDVFGYGGRMGVQDVIAGGPGFVAVGNDGDSNAAAWLSVDGRDWVRVEGDAFLATEEDDWTVGMWSVTEGGPGFVAIGPAGLSGGTGTRGGGFDRMAVWLSADGTDWERSADLEDKSPGSVSSDPESGRVIAFGSDMWTSDDGYTWTKSEQQDPRIQPRWEPSLAWDGDRVVAGGPDVNLSLWVSGDRGSTWSRIDRNNPVFEDSGVGSVTRFGDTFVAVSDFDAAVWIGTWDD